MTHDGTGFTRRGFLGRGPLSGALLASGTLALPGRASAETTFDKDKKDGYVRIGFANEVPFAYADANGKLTGEAPEILRVVLKKLGIGEVDGVLTEFGALIPGLQAGRFDIISAGMYVTPLRCQQILFSEPTYSLAEQFAVKSGNPLHMATYSEVAANPNVRIAFTVSRSGSPGPAPTR